jgi:hypothetical protein
MPANITLVRLEPQADRNSDQCLIIQRKVSKIGWQLPILHAVMGGMMLCSGSQCSMETGMPTKEATPLFITSICMDGRRCLNGSRHALEASLEVSDVCIN